MFVPFFQCTCVHVLQYHSRVLSFVIFIFHSDSNSVVLSLFFVALSKLNCSYQMMYRRADIKGKIIKYIKNKILSRSSQKTQRTPMTWTPLLQRINYCIYRMTPIAAPISKGSHPLFMFQCINTTPIVYESVSTPHIVLYPCIIYQNRN